MDIVAALRTEERKLLTAQQEVAGKLRGVVAAIQALNGPASSSRVVSSERGSKLKGRKLSAAHRLAIKQGIARRKAFARKAGK
jgi:hypothetical protein